MVKTMVKTKEGIQKSLKKMDKEKKKLEELLQLAENVDISTVPYYHALKVLKADRESEERRLRNPYEQINYGDYQKQMRLKLHKKVWIYRYWLDGMTWENENYTELKWQKCLSKGQLLCLTEAHNLDIFKRLEIWKPVKKNKKEVVIPVDPDPILVGFIECFPSWRTSAWSCKYDIERLADCRSTFKICEWEE